MTADKSALSNLIARLRAEQVGGGETVELEFKEAQFAIPRRAYESICAFANTSGGFLLLGVADGGEVTGVVNPSDLVKELFDSLRNPQKISTPVCRHEDVEVVGLGEKSVIVVRVPAASRRQRPVYIKGNPYKGTFIRRHESNYTCSKQEVDRMMREAPAEATDQAVLRDYSIEDLDSRSVARYRRQYSSVKAASPWNAYDDLPFLRAIGAVGEEESHPTVAGLLVLGESSAILRWRGKHLIDYRQLGESAVDWVDRVAWEGNLLEGFHTLFPKLTGNLPSPFRLKGATRIDDSVAHVALREALVNLLVHADYAEQASSLVLRSLQEFIFRNPGSSRVPHNDLFSADRSDARNPTIMRMFRLIGLSEEAGTGLPRIAAAWRELGLTLPKVDVGTERYEFKIALSHVHLISEQDHEWLSTLDRGLTNDERLALATARRTGRIDNASLREMTGGHSADTTKLLGGLRDRGLLEMHGKGKGAWYEIPPEHVEEAEQVSLDLGPEGSKPSLVHTTFAELPTEDVDRLFAIAKTVRETARTPSDQLTDVVVSLCRITPLSRAELAELLNRDSEYLGHALREIRGTGRVGYLYENAPRHPDQRYVVPEAYYPGDRVRITTTGETGTVKEVNWEGSKGGSVTVLVDARGPRSRPRMEGHGAGRVELIRRNR